MVPGHRSTPPAARPNLLHSPPKATTRMAADKNPFAKFLTHFAKGHVLFHEGDEGE